MKPLSYRHLVAASAVALTVGLGIAGAQQAQPETQPQVNEQAQQAANNNEPLSAPESVQAERGVMPQSFADLVAEVEPAVVNITTTSVVSQPANGQGPIFPPGSPFEDLFRDFGFPGMPGPGGPGGPGGGGGQGAPQRSNALGSGFVISSDGYIVTNNHVIDGADEIEIEFYSGNKLPAKVIGKDPNTDVALLKVESDEPTPFVKFGDSDEARVGDWVLALGNPLGQGFSASSGIVSARNRELSGTYDDYLQTDAAINRGNSGGPLFNLDGEVIGVNTAILSPNGGSIGIGFSMASNVVSKVVNQLKEFGETRRGWLGVMIQDVTPDMAEALGLAAEYGVMVTDVPEGPAKDAGLASGDVIISFDGTEVKDSGELVRKVGDAPSGKAVPVVVMRGGDEKTLDVTLGRREQAEGADGNGSEGGNPQEPATQDVLGMTVEPITPQLAAELGISSDQKGLVVKEVDPTGAAADKGLLAGDIITEAGQQPVTSLADLKARIDEAREAGRKSVLILIRRGDAPRFVALPVDKAAE